MRLLTKINDFLTQWGRINGKRRALLKKKHSGSIIEYGLIVTMIVGAAIAGLGYIGLAVQRQLSVLTGAIGDGTVGTGGNGDDSEGNDGGSGGNDGGSGGNDGGSEGNGDGSGGNGDGSGGNDGGSKRNYENELDVIKDSNYTTKVTGIESILENIRGDANLSDGERIELGDKALDVLDDPPGASTAYDSYKLMISNIMQGEYSITKKGNDIISLRDIIAENGDLTGDEKGGLKMVCEIFLIKLGAQKE